jgi:hypothetical protein
MSDNELRKQIMSMIRNSNLDETMFSVGIGEDYDKQRNRFVYDFSNKKNKEAIRYALKYFKKYDICLIWTVLQPTDETRSVRRWVVSAPAEAILNCTGQGISKSVEFNGRNTENVYVTTLNGLPDFLAQYGHLFR